MTESRTHFGAWAIVSSPLVLSFDFANSTNLDLHWPTVTNRDALAVNAAYAGFSGGLFFESDDETEFSPCGFRAGLTCSWPRLMSWYKPLGGDDSRGSTMAVLLMNNGDGPTTLSFAYADVPGVANATTSCAVYDVWARAALGRVGGGRFERDAVASRDSVFLTLGECR